MKQYDFIPIVNQFNFHPRSNEVLYILWQPDASDSRWSANNPDFGSPQLFLSASTPVYDDAGDLLGAVGMHLAANYQHAVFNSELYNFPAFPVTVPELYEDDCWLDADPFGSKPIDKLKFLKDADRLLTIWY
ncbi:hypothetical protein KFU94_62330 [Chloroflexi bacterium TSY]|nr:hypothetical protein [Chloroflexi bacterium TSY]